MMLVINEVLLSTEDRLLDFLAEDDYTLKQLATGLSCDKLYPELTRVQIVNALHKLDDLGKIFRFSSSSKWRKKPQVNF